MGPLRGLPAFFDFSLLWRFLAPERGSVSDVLHGFGVGGLAQGFQLLLSRLCRVSGKLDLDQLVVRQRTVQLRQYTLGYAVLSDANHGLERMGSSLQVFLELIVQAFLVVVRLIEYGYCCVPNCKRQRCDDRM